MDDTALVKQGRHSVGVQRQYCGQLGKRANCQALVSLTLTRGEVPVPVALRLFLPDAWAKDAGRRRAAGVPGEVEGRPKWRVALDEIGRLRTQGVRFGCVLGDAEYGKAAAFRRALDDRGLVPPAAPPPAASRTDRQGAMALGIPPNQKVFAPGVTTAMPERKFHLTSHPATASLEQLAASIKARWCCEQAHQQLKEELGLDHYEGRSWRGLHHHALLCQMAFAFLQCWRAGKKGGDSAEPRRTPPRRRNRPCPSCAAPSSPPRSAISPAARNADTKHPGTCRCEYGRVVVEGVEQLSCVMGG